METVVGPATAPRAAVGARRASARRWWPAFAVACLALPAGAAAGWAATERDDGTRADVVVAGGGRLTERQQEMASLAQAYVAAWQAGDGAAAAALMTGDAVVTYPRMGLDVRPSDGSLQARIADNPAYQDLRVLAPVLVHADAVHLTGTIPSLGVAWASVLEFTVDGPVRIAGETIWLS